MRAKNAKTYKRGDPIAVLGMSGAGKTRVAAMMRREAGWFHYSVDYRIGTRYMGEAIVDNFKREAMKTPFLRDLLKTDSIYISSNISFDNLDPLSTFLGKPGDPEKGGIAFEEYLRRQRLHRGAEIASLRDVPVFAEKAQAIYGYDHFICDTGGSICEVVDPANPDDEILSLLSETCLIIYLEGDDNFSEALKTRFDASPKPMYYSEEFLKTCWSDYLHETGVSDTDVDPDHFIRWGFARLIDWRRPRYKAIADNWGISIPASAIEKIDSPDAFLDLVEDAVT